MTDEHRIKGIVTAIDQKTILPDAAIYLLVTILNEIRADERERIRKAFWKIFKESGEIFFPDCKMDSDCEAEVQSYWDDLIEAIKNQNEAE